MEGWAQVRNGLKFGFAFFAVLGWHVHASAPLDITDAMAFLKGLLSRILA